MYTICAFDFGSDYGDCDSDFSCFNIVFGELVSEEVVIVMGPGEVVATMVDIGKMIVRTGKWLHMDKEITV